MANPMKTDKTLYFLEIAEAVSKASPDEATKCGCVLTDMDNRIISTGYNGYPRDTNNNVWPKGRPDKYYITEHSEKNAILNCAVVPRHIGGGKAFVNGICCYSCLLDLWQFGISEVYQANMRPKMVDEEHERIKEKIIRETGLLSVIVGV